MCVLPGAMYAMGSASSKLMLLLTRRAHRVLIQISTPRPIFGQTTRFRPLQCTEQTAGMISSWITPQILQNSFLKNGDKVSTVKRLETHKICKLLPSVADVAGRLSYLQCERRRILKAPYLVFSGNWIKIPNNI